MSHSSPTVYDILVTQEILISALKPRQNQTASFSTLMREETLKRGILLDPCRWAWPWMRLSSAQLESQKLEILSLQMIQKELLMLRPHFPCLLLREGDCWRDIRAILVQAQRTCLKIMCSLKVYSMWTKMKTAPNIKHHFTGVSAATWTQVPAEKTCRY